MLHRCKQGTQENRKLQSIQRLPNGFVQILLPTKDILNRKHTHSHSTRHNGTASRKPIFQTKRRFAEKHLLALQSNEMLTPGIKDAQGHRLASTAFNRWISQYNPFKSTKGLASQGKKQWRQTKHFCHRMLGHTFQFLQPTNVKMAFFSFESSLSSVTGNNPWPLGSSLIQPASKLSASALGHSGETSLKITHHSNFPKNTPIKKILHPSPGIQKTRKSYQGCNWLYTNKQTYHHQEHPSPSNFPTWPSFPHPGPFPPPSLGVSKLLKSTIQHWKGHSACPFPSDVANLSYRS